MRDVTIALLPASLFGVYNFGINALLVILAAVAGCVLTEYVYCKAMKQAVSTGDFSAVVTGLLLAMNVPASMPIWMVVVGSIFAILIVKMLYGGLGQNFMNPALAARIFLMISFPGKMASFAVEKASSTGFMDVVKHGKLAVDAASSATPLADLKAGTSVDLMKLFIGNHGGTIGETSAIAILIGAIYLLARKVISFRIPVIYIATTVLFIGLFGGKGFDPQFLLAHVLGGGLLLGAFFMATDYVTGPTTVKGQIIFAVFLGLMTGVFRTLGSAAEGVSYAIVLGNILVPLIEKISLTKPFGTGKERATSGK